MKRKNPGDRIKDEPALTGDLGRQRVPLDDSPGFTPTVDLDNDSVNDEPALAGGKVIESELWCESCGYNLQTRRVGDPCPECGHVQFQPPSSTDRPGYAAKLLRDREHVSPKKSWVVAFAMAAAAGPLAILGALMGTFSAWGLTAVVIAPAVEEIMKVAAAVMLLEVYPALVRSLKQLIAITITSAFVFATIENLIYLNVYIPNPTTEIAAFRWTVCTTLHVTCTAIATVGVARMYQAHRAQLKPPEVKVALPMVVLAMIVHGTYNFTVTVLEVSGVLF